MEQHNTSKPMRTIAVWAPPNYQCVLTHIPLEEAELNEMKLQRQEGDLDLPS